MNWKKVIPNAVTFSRFPLEAIKAMGNIKDERVVPNLIAMAEDEKEKWFIRELAEKTLRKIGTPGARAALEELKRPKPVFRTFEI